MSKLNTFRELERKLMLELEKLDSMQGDKEVEAELEFERKLKALIKEYNLSNNTVISIALSGA